MLVCSHYLLVGKYIDIVRRRCMLVTAGGENCVVLELPCKHMQVSWAAAQVFLPNKKNQIPPSPEAGFLSTRPLSFLPAKNCLCWSWCVPACWQFLNPECAGILASNNYVTMLVAFFLMLINYLTSSSPPAAPTPQSKGMALVAYNSR